MDKNKVKNMEIPENLKKLSPNQLWLLEHQITAFWHGFGFSNTMGWIIPKEMIEEYKFPREKIAHHVIIKKEFIEKKLAEYLEWLRDYKKSWNENKDYDHYPRNFEEFLKGEAIHESRKPILEMICLLQDNNRGGESFDTV